jgi:hypothetical protein
VRNSDDSKKKKKNPSQSINRLTKKFQKEHDVRRKRAGDDLKIAMDNIGKIVTEEVGGIGKLFENSKSVEEEDNSAFFEEIDQVVVFKDDDEKAST